jgi:hypothetical protein
VWVIEIDFFSLSVDLYWFMKILGVLMGRRTFRASELHCRREVMGTFQMADGSHREKKFDIDIVTHWQMALPKIHKFICQSLLTTLAPRQCQRGIQRLQ